MSIAFTLAPLAISNSTTAVLPFKAAAYGHLGREQDAQAAVEKANALRAKAGWGALTLLTVRQDLFRWVGDRKPLREGLAKAGVGSGGDWFALVTTTSSGYAIKGATTIDVATAKALHDRGVPFVDVYHLWPQERIPGAYFLEVWHGEFEFNEVRLLEIVDKNQEVVIYSSEGAGRRRGANATAEALTWGFQKVYYFPEGGLSRWKAAGYPVEKGG